MISTVGRFKAAGLVAEFDKKLFLDQLGITLVSESDRVPRGEALAHYLGNLAEDGEYRVQQSAHNAGVADLANRFEAEGYFVAAGWRWTVTHRGPLQLKPDLWLLTPMTDCRSLIVAVEYELTAKYPKGITDKLQPYRTALQEFGQAIPLLVVTGDKDPEKGKEKKDAAEKLIATKRFAEQGDDLPMLVTYRNGALRGDFSGPRSVWIYRGNRVDIQHLQTLVADSAFIEPPYSNLEIRLAQSDESL